MISTTILSTKFTAGKVILLLMLAVILLLLLLLLHVSRNLAAVVDVGRDLAAAAVEVGRDFAAAIDVCHNVAAAAVDVCRDLAVDASVGFGHNRGGCLWSCWYKKNPTYQLTL